MLSLKNWTPDEKIIGRKGRSIAERCQQGRFVLPAFAITVNEVAELDFSQLGQMLEMFGDEVVEVIVRSSGVKSAPGVLESVTSDSNLENVQSAVQTVRDSWFSDRAKKYRDWQNQSHDIQMAILVQLKAKPIYSGVANSLDPANGEPYIVGEWVDGDLDRYCKGIQKGKPLEKGLRDLVYMRLLDTVREAEEDNRWPVEIEWVWDGRFPEPIAVQTRDANMTDMAFFTWLKNSPYYEPDPIKLKHYLSVYDIEKCQRLETSAAPLMKGTYISGQPFAGTICRIPSKVDKTKIYVGRFNTTNDLEIISQCGGIVTNDFGAYSHIADLCRKHNIPAAICSDFDFSSDNDIFTIANGNIYKGTIEFQTSNPLKNWFHQSNFSK